MSFVIVEEIVLDRMRSKAQAKNEFVMPEMRVIAHDVPQHRPATDRHHRLRHRRITPGPHAHAEASTEQHDLHAALPLSVIKPGLSRRGSANSRMAGATGLPTSKPSVLPASIPLAYTSSASAAASTV